MSLPNGQVGRGGAGVGQPYPFTPRIAAALLVVARPEASSAEIRSKVRGLVDPDRTLLDGPTAGGAFRGLLGADHWDACLRSVASRQPPSLEAILAEVMRRADGAPPLDRLRNLDTLNREPTTGRPRSVRALVDDLLKVAPAWPAPDPRIAENAPRGPDKDEGDHHV